MMKTDGKLRGSLDRYSMESKCLPKSLRRLLCDDNSSTEKGCKSSSEYLNVDDSKGPEKSKRRRWFSIILAWIIIFSSLIQFSMFSSILGPFLLMLDPSVSKQFAVWPVVAYSFGQMITPPLFGFWCGRIRKCRLPLSTGLVIMISGNLAFCCLEAFPVNSRRWVMIVIRIVIGLGAGIVSVGRSYCAMASTKTERAIAIAGSTACLGLSVMAGPGAQGLFSLIGYPGVFISRFHLHMYNAPAFASVFIFLVLLVLNSTLLLEEYPGIEKRQQSESVFSTRALPKYDKLGAWLLVWTWFCIWTALTNFVIVGVPFTQAQFDWSLPQAILYNGGIFGAFAAMSLVVYSCFAFCGSKWDDRVPIIVGMMFMLTFYLFTMPWPFYPLPSNDLLNSTSELQNISVQCKFASKDWCFATPRIPVYVYLFSLIFLAAGFPIANSSMSTLLSKLLGPRQQGIMQGVFVTTGGFARLLGPLVISLIFTRFGPQMSWTFTIVLLSTGLFAAVVFRKRFVPLVVEPKLKPGDYYRYKQGIVYRF